MNTYIPEPIKCSFCHEEAHWYANWRHGLPEYVVILDETYEELGDKNLYCDKHQEWSSNIYRPIP